MTPREEFHLLSLFKDYYPALLQDHGRGSGGVVRQEGRFRRRRERRLLGAGPGQAHLPLGRNQGHDGNGKR